MCERLCLQFVYIHLSCFSHGPLWNVDKGLQGAHQIFETFVFSLLSTHGMKPYIFTGCNQGGKVTFGNRLCTLNHILLLSIIISICRLSLLLVSILQHGRTQPKIARGGSPRFRRAPCC